MASPGASTPADEGPQDFHTGPRVVKAGGFGRVLLAWIGIFIVLQSLRWGGGIPAAELAAGIEEGASRVESRIRGEVSEELIRKAIRDQRDARSFWSVIGALGDFLVEPAALAFRAVLVATLFTGIAALAGRTPGYDRALFESSMAQGFWVLGLAVRLGLAAALGRGDADVETSAVLFLPPGAHPAWLWLALRQVELFALAGWTVMACQAARRGDSPAWLASALCLSLALLEALIRLSVALVMGGAIRLSLLVE
ncbi:hypothetical protein [Aquisphaera insulae]|uniref:hypothetical protein n=1 Tax=Aquisphaera insulae TaxID=2712864 RepID=UPI0013EDD552|nr:hypothetical protein [Aquisphaera insulae]